jgi:hypothetical protein
MTVRRKRSSELNRLVSFVAAFRTPSSSSLLLLRNRVKQASSVLVDRRNVKGGQRARQKGFFVARFERSRRFGGGGDGEVKDAGGGNSARQVDDGQRRRLAAGSRGVV